jgi:Uma2 family endonuclease
LSKKDRKREVQEKIDEFLRFGVRYVWVIDPRSQEGWEHTTAGVQHATDGILRTKNPNLELPLPEIFSAL